MGRVYGASADRAYGFYWALQPFASRSYSESFWTIAESWAPILTVANFGGASDEVTVELTSNTGSYTLPVFALQPSESRTINIRDIVNSGALDAKGKPFPADATFGGYRIYGASRRSQLVVKEHLIDPDSKLSTPFYGEYIYDVYLYFIPNDMPSDGPSTDVYYNVDPSEQDSVGLVTSIDESDGSTNDGGGCPATTWEYGNPYHPSNSNVSVAKSGCEGIATGVDDGSSTVSAEDDFATVDAEGDQGTLYTNNHAQITVRTAPSGCPTDINVTSFTAVGLQNDSPNAHRQFPYLKTGVGGFAQMTVSDPGGHNWNGIQLSETVTDDSNSCSTTYFPSCSSINTSALFTVGAGGQSVYGVTLTPTMNVVWDMHTATATYDALAAAGQTSCQLVCDQSYSCRGTTLANQFKITYAFSEATISGTSVTQVVVTKVLK